MKDYYKILDIHYTASSEEIKKSYRDLAKKYHPDVNKGDVFSEEIFKEINEAFEVLSNPNERHHYDDLYSYVFLKQEEHEQYFEGFNIEVSNKGRRIARKYFLYFFVSAFVITILLIIGIHLSNKYHFHDENDVGNIVTITDNTGGFAKRTQNGLSIDLHDTTNLIISETTRIGNKTFVNVTINFKNKRFDTIAAVNKDSLYVPIQELLRKNK